MTRKSNRPATLEAAGIVGYTIVGGRAVRASAVPVVKQSLTTEPVPKGRGQWHPYRSKLEWRAAQYLASIHPGEEIRYEEQTFSVGSIGGKHGYYKPDFCLPFLPRQFIYEVKGGHRWRRHGIERLRAAAARWPMHNWYLVEWVDNEWKIQRVEG